MRYTDFKTRPCPCCFPVLSEQEGFGLTFDRGQFYANMRLLLKTGIASDLEGVDTMVRLGYLENNSFQEIINRFELEHPVPGAESRGSFDPDSDTVALTFQYVFEPGSITSGTSTLAHELRHRAFHVISTTPELRDLMPDDLRNRWRDGWGINQTDQKKWRAGGNAIASPEHAMIYAVQFQDPLASSRTRVFLTHDALEGETVEYWRDLYRQAESAIKNWLRGRAVIEEPPEVTADQPAPAFRMDPKMEAFYRSFQRLHKWTREDLASDIRILTMDAQDLWGKTLLAMDRDDPVRRTLSELSLAMLESRFGDVPALLEAYRGIRHLITDPTADDFDRRLAAFESTGITWRLLDPRTFNQEEFDAMVRLNPSLIQPVPVVRVPVEPEPGQRGSASAGTAAQQPATPAAPQGTVVVPTGPNIGFYQWAASNKIGSDTIWDLVTSSVSTNTLRANMQGLIAVYLQQSGLKITEEGEAQLSALYTMLDAGGYDREAVMQMLARVALVKR